MGAWVDLGSAGLQEKSLGGSIRFRCFGRRVEEGSVGFAGPGVLSFSR